MITTQQLFDKYENKYLDVDKNSGAQCVDVVKAYFEEVIGIPPVKGNAVDYWNSYPSQYFDRITNSPSAIPNFGDIVIWGTGIGQYGHIAIYQKGNTVTFTSFDQNYPYGTFCHFQNHNYNHVLGWLRPRLNQTTMPNPIDQVVANKINEFRIDGSPTVYEVFAVPSEEFFLQTLQDKWENVRMLPSDWPLDPKDWPSQRNTNQSQVIDLQGQLAEARTDVDLLTKANGELRAEITNRQNDVTTISQELTKVENERDTMKHTADNLQRQIEALQGQPAMSPGSNLSPLSFLIDLIRNIWRK